MMSTRLARIFVGALAAFLLFVTFAPEALSQRKRTSRRATNPARARTSPTPDTTSGEPSVVSTADEQDATPRRTTPRRQQREAPAAQAENDQLHGTVRDLSTQVEQLNGQINQMKSDQRAMYDLERLTRAEQRTEDLRRQLREITDKEFQYQERLAEIDYESQSDSSQRRAALIGSLNPSDVRDAIAQQLERERARIKKQLELLGASHTRLEAAVASADAEVERLRARVDAADAAQQQSTPAPDAATGTTTPAPQPNPTPTPAQPPGLPE
jgi:outer membrane murein-binding lipoprotein Lpp